MTPSIFHFFPVRWQPPFKLSYTCCDWQLWNTAWNIFSIPWLYEGMLQICVLVIWGKHSQINYILKKKILTLVSDVQCVKPCKQLCIIDMSCFSDRFSRHMKRLKDVNESCFLILSQMSFNCIPLRMYSKDPFHSKKIYFSFGFIALYYTWRQQMLLSLRPPHRVNLAYQI